jgi:hypothetical protein
MPSVPLETFIVADDAVGIVEYNDANQRISRFYWQGVPSGVTVYVTIWDLNVGPDPVYEGSFMGSGETNISGNRQAVEETVEGETYWAIPPEIRVAFQAVKAGTWV